MKRKSLAILFMLALMFAAPVLAQSGARSSTHYGILMDNTGSMRHQLDRVIGVARELLDRMGDRDSVSVFHFEEDDPTKSDFAKFKVKIEATRDKAAAREYVENLFIVPGQTTLLDAILASAEKTVSAAAGDADAEKVLIVITDGEDRASKTRREDLIKYLRENRVKVHAVGFTEQLNSAARSPRRDVKDRAEKFLKEMSAETGGKAIFPTAGDDAGSSVENLLSEKNR